MKVKKVKRDNKVQACGDPSAIPLAQVSTSPIECDPRTEARSYIQSAISALSVIAKEDSIIKESIANLAVVLLDLQ